MLIHTVHTACTGECLHAMSSVKMCGLYWWRKHRYVLQTPQKTTTSYQPTLPIPHVKNGDEPGTQQWQAGTPARQEAL